jgi:hypothetical protein
MFGLEDLLSTSEYPVFQAILFLKRSIGRQAWVRNVRAEILRDFEPNVAVGCRKAEVWSLSYQRLSLRGLSNNSLKLTNVG